MSCFQIQIEWVGTLFLCHVCKIFFDENGCVVAVWSRWCDKKIIFHSPRASREQVIYQMHHWNTFQERIRMQCLLCRFEEAKKKIEQKYDEIERALIEEFVQAQNINSFQKMKEIASILSYFKGYSQCVDAFIEQSQKVISFFLMSSHLNTFD